MVTIIIAPSSDSAQEYLNVAYWSNDVVVGLFESVIKLFGVKVPFQSFNGIVCWFLAWQAD